ncbi:MAG: GNAT family N-acetyltransferase, partial [Saprospiraceae bacterium]|nr:GNAT family N-acetyltransferase [Saprospiraceae bacterium]
MNIRIAQIQDCPAILDIYTYYVQQTAITFEYETPSLTEMENRMTYTQAKYPYLVAEVDQRIVGYAYAS